MARASASKARVPGGGLKGKRKAPRRRRPVPHLFERWDRIAGRLRSARRVALFLDFDGTLVPFRRRPKDVRLNPETRRILSRLAASPRVRVWIISGRRYADVRRRAGIARVRYLGLHGWERGDQRGLPGQARVWIEAAWHLLSVGLASFPHIWIEDKGLCLVIHYRRAPASEVRRARPLVHAILKAFDNNLRLMDGNKIWEVLSRKVKGKGEAVRGILAELPGSPLAFYLGDDTTDEAAFAALPRGITVRVRKPRATRARFFLRNPKEVRQFLEKLEAEIG
jgi:trehalose-phosphatase